MSEAERMFSRDIVSILMNVRERPWNDGRKQATELWLAAQLRPYGIKPKAMRMGQEMARGYVRADFSEVFARYAPFEEKIPEPAKTEG